MNKLTYIYIAVITLFFGCEKVVELDLEQSTPQIVIEGLLTNKDSIQFVKVSRSIQFYEAGFNPVTNAVINVSGGGNLYTYSHNPSAVDSLNGFYFSDAPFAGKIGESYTLSVDVNGVSYVAEDTMRNVTTIDSLSFQLARDPFEEDVIAGRIYQALLYASEPAGSQDYYQFQFFRNHQLITDSNNIFVFSDESFGPTLNGLPSPVLFREGEVASVRIYSLTREQYLFYTDLSNLLNSDGGMFSPPPANPRNSFSNNALGLWQVSAINEASIKISF